MTAVPVTVAVVSWNTRELLRSCLDSLRSDAEAGRAEVFVVDNASSDGSAELVEREFPWVTLVALDENVGFGSAVNLVAERREGSWLALANADVELLPGALEELLRTAARHDDTAVVAPRLILPDGATQHSVYPFPTLALTLIFNLRLHLLIPGLGDRLCLEGQWDPEKPRVVDWAVGAFLLVRRSAFDAVGGFDAEQWLYAEDLDLGWRLRQAGWTTRYEPLARVRHTESAATVQAFGDGRTARWMAATYAWMVRRRGLAFAWAAAAINLAGSIAQTAGLTALARIWPARFAEARRAARSWLPIHRAGLRPPSKLLESARAPEGAGATSPRRRPGES